MILQELHDLHGRFEKDENYDVAPDGYSIQKVSFVIVLDTATDGTLRDFDIIDYREGQGSQRRARMVTVPGKAKPTGKGINPCWLWDNSSYLLGYKTPDKDPEKTASDAARALETFAASRKFHLELERELASSSYSAVCRFFEKWDTDQVSKWRAKLDQFAATGFGVFQLRSENRFVHQDPQIVKWWDLRQGAILENANHDICLITGEALPVAELHEPKIKGVKDSQGAGALIVSFNASAYESYAKESGFNAPVSTAAASKYSKVLNALLASDKHREQIADATTVFWTEVPTRFEASFSSYLGSYSDDEEDDEQAEESVPAQRTQFLQKLHGTLRKVRAGGLPEPDIAAESEKKFCILGLTGQAGGRIGIRFWHRSTVGSLLENLADHHASLEIARPTKNREGDLIGWEFPTFTQLIKQTAREPKNIPPNLIAPMIRAAIEGGRYPDALATCIIRRIRADRRIDPAFWGENALETYQGRESAYLRAAILKAWLIRNHHQTISMTYDPTNKAPAYRLGALFALLEKTQQDALGDVNAGIRDRFYSSASATPASVFPVLLKTYGHHLSKAQSEWGSKWGADKAKRIRGAREKDVESILAEPERINGFPAHLNLRDQGLFAIGYYHKRKDLWTSSKPETEASPDQNL